MKPIPIQVIYSLEGKNESDISPIWQILQVFFYASCMLLGFVICWLFTQVINLMKSHCVLHADLLLTYKTFDIVRNQNVSCTVDILQPTLRWNHCDVILMIAIVSTTIAAFLLVMFSYCGRGGAGKAGMPDAWRIVWPAIIINGVCSCLVIYSSVDYTKGFISFKNNIEKQWKMNATNFDLSEIGCLQLGNDVVGEELSRGLYLLKEFMYLWVSFWALNLFWILSRCLFNIDFQLVRTTVYEYPRSPMLVRRPVIKHISDENRESPAQITRTVKFRPVQSSDIFVDHYHRRKTHTSGSSSSSTS